jgi:hypothetical protein
MVGRRNCIPIPEVFDEDVKPADTGRALQRDRENVLPESDIPNSGIKPKAGTPGTPVMNRSFLLGKPAFLYLILYDSLVTLMKKPLIEKMFPSHITKNRFLPFRAPDKRMLVPYG